MMIFFFTVPLPVTLYASMGFMYLLLAVPLCVLMLGVLNACITLIQRPMDQRMPETHRMFASHVYHATVH
jgi:hypothetical protein